MQPEAQFPCEEQQETLVWEIGWSTMKMKGTILPMVDFTIGTPLAMKEVFARQVG